MPSPVRIEAGVWDDWRFECLAAELGVELETVVGRMAKLWSHATDREVYAVPEGAIRAFLKSTKAVDALVVSDLGERMDGGMVRLRGSKRFDDLWKKRTQRRESAKLGGEIRAEANRDVVGRFVSGTTNLQPQPQPHASRQPADSQPQSSLSVSVSVSGSDSSSDSNPERGEQARKPKRSKPQTRLSDDWKPTAQAIAKAVASGLDVNREAEKFRNNAAQNDRKCANWDAAFSNWLLKAEEFRSRPPAQQSLSGRANPLPPEAYGIGDKEF